MHWTRQHRLAFKASEIQMIFLVLIGLDPRQEVGWRQQPLSRRKLKPSKRESPRAPGAESANISEKLLEVRWSSCVSGELCPSSIFVWRTRETWCWSLSWLDSVQRERGKIEPRRRSDASGNSLQEHLRVMRAASSIGTKDGRQIALRTKSHIIHLG